MKRNRIDESNILATTAIVLIILSTGVRSEHAEVDISKSANSDINCEMVSSSEKLQEQLAAIINGMQQNVNAIKAKIHKEMQQNVNSINDKMQQIMAAIGNETQRDMLSKFNQRQENPQWPRTCADALLTGNGKSGIYQLYLNDYKLRPFKVQCLSDPDNGPAWTIIQRPQDNSTDFYRGWREYQCGFGDINTNYFIGLNRIYLMTRAQPHELWIELKDFEDETRYAKYNAFGIGDEYDWYNLHTLGKFVGNAGNSLTYSKGYNFTTKDSDNDENKANCAKIWKGAWWHQSCSESNLNAKYEHGLTGDFGGIFWHHWRGQKYSLKYVHMAIRPK